MVYRGKPSRGCENCRKLHKSCDEKHPACSRCTRTQKRCLGYRNQTDLMFHNENTRTKARFRQWHARTSGSASTSANNASLSPLFSAGTNLMYSDPVTLTYSLSLPREEVVINYFYHTVLDNLSDEDPVRYLLTQLPNLYATSDPGSALRLATEAVSYASYTTLVPGAALLCRKRYVEAIKAIGQAIQDPAEVVSDQTLYAVLLLCGYETTAQDPTTASAWGAPVDGAAAIVKFRGMSQVHSTLSRSMFWFLRRSVVLSHMQTCRPIGDVFSGPNVTTPLHDSPEYRLISIAAEIPNLQYQSNHLFSQPRDAIENEVENLFRSARALESEISNWELSVPTTWSYSAATNVNDHPSSDFSPRQIHRYPNIYTARVWNFYRVSRLIIQSVLIRTISWMSSSMDFNRFDEIRKVEISSAELVDDICASVYFLLGYDLSKMKLLSSSGGTKEDKTSGHGVKGSDITQRGRFSLIWPLYVTSSSLSVPEAQRDWMRMQLRFLANHGETQAQSVYSTRSQILLGGADHIRFDCV
ncbi:C6 zinc finger protein [Colletotrichum cereale]|nr:C6 zinc finger protein [Colletotrichum cereale]